MKSFTFLGAKTTAIMAFLYVFFSLVGNTHAQGNSIAGTVYGVGRRPVADVYVELRDEFSRSLQRARTNSTGRYAFYGLVAGRFKIAVLPYDLPYQDQEQDVELISFARTATGGGISTGFNSEIVDIILKLRDRAVLGPNGTIFAQDVPQKARELYDKALSDLDNKNDAAAFVKLRDALEIFPKYYSALNRLGNEYIRLKHYEAAAILLAMASEINPNSYSAWYGLAYSKYSLGNISGAAPAVEKAVELNPASPQALLLSGSVLRQQGKFKESEKRLLKAQSESKNTVPQVHWELALLYGNGMKRYADAARELKTFLKSQPDSKDTERINKLIATFEEKSRGT